MYILFFIKISIQNSPNKLDNFWYKRSATGHAALRCLPTSRHNSTTVLAGTGCLHDGALSWWPLIYKMKTLVVLPWTISLMHQVFQIGIHVLIWTNQLVMSDTVIFLSHCELLLWIFSISVIIKRDWSRDHDHRALLRLLYASIQYL